MPGAVKLVGDGWVMEAEREAEAMRIVLRRQARGFGAQRQTARRVGADRERGDSVVFFCARQTGQAGQKFVLLGPALQVEAQ